MPTDNRLPDNTDLLIRLLKVMVDKDKHGSTEPEGSTLRDPMIVAHTTGAELFAAHDRLLPTRYGHRSHA
jgi:hypothetical protein